MSTAPTGLGQVMVPVQDLTRATAFYRDCVGLQHLFTVPGMAFFDCGGVRLMLGVPDKPELAPPGSILYYRVPDIAAAYSAMRDRGAVEQEKPQAVATVGGKTLWLAFLRDPEGNVFSLMSEVAA